MTARDDYPWDHSGGSGAQRWPLETWRTMCDKIDQLVELGNAMRDGIDRLAHYIASNGESDVYTSMLEALMLSAVRWDNHHREVAQ